ncbi:heparinase II/III-family protein [Parapedobacter tibetensis]|uniref:heparinase II/III-family protein n=1 Tax=Parapedobacter tibetensis TaxID=2972951 RepID=UPI00214DB952|nr:heparinase II/III-family protein [Parapedobacter tibetensis]
MNTFNNQIGREACFLTREERERILAGGGEVNVFRPALRDRVLARTAQPQLPQPEDGTGWWYPAFEYLSDAAMLYAIEQDQHVGDWLRQVALSIARYPAGEWVGPWFRDHSQPYTGHLETAHVCWGIASVLDLAAAAFTPAEHEEVSQALLEKGVIPCERWLAKNTHLANWRGIMLAGVLVPSAVLGDRQRLEDHVPLMAQCLAAFQPDGSYAESVQYGNYLAHALMLVYESLVRVYTDYASTIAVEAYAMGIPWVVSSMLYAKPLSGWGEESRARAVNFNDSAAIFRPSGDLLLHIAARCTHTDQQAAGLASYLFHTYYVPVPSQEPHHLASFGFVNDWGFLTLPLLGQAATRLSPSDAGLPLTAAFENGNTFVRDAWNGDTVIALQAGASPLHGPGHLHGDVNSFMLAHQRERLLIDPGHSCYRNLIHGLESSSQTHNTCTFLIEEGGLGLQEDLTKTKLLEQQSILSRRLIVDGVVGSPILRGNNRLIVERIAEVSVVGAEASACYGPPLTAFSRFWVVAGSHVVFVIDQIQSAVPVRTSWNWIINNRDGLASVTVEDQQLTIHRPLAGLKLLQGGPARPVGPVYGYAHDAYHPEPARLGEGRPGSGLIFRAIEPVAQTNRCAVHVLVADKPDKLGDWTLSTNADAYEARSPEEHWILTLTPGEHMAFTLNDRIGGRSWQLTALNGRYGFNEVMKS